MPDIGSLKSPSPAEPSRSIEITSASWSPPSESAEAAVAIARLPPFKKARLDRANGSMDLPARAAATFQSDLRPLLEWELCELEPQHSDRVKRKIPQQGHLLTRANTTTTNGALCGTLNGTLEHDKASSVLPALAARKSRKIPSQEESLGSSDWLAPGKRSRWFTLGRRPYLPVAARKRLLNGTGSPLPTFPIASTLHVDFSEIEISHLRTYLEGLAGESSGVEDTKAVCRAMRKLKKQSPSLRPEQILGQLDARIVRGRELPDVESFLKDAWTRSTAAESLLLTIRKHVSPQIYHRSVSSILLGREVFGSQSQHACNITNALRNIREDGLELRRQWTNCAGDIFCMTWISNRGFLCGTTVHSDTFNMQYNKPGNLVLGMCRSGVVRAYPHHKIVRPLVTAGENATDEMRQSQDAWLYTSVVSTDYDATNERAYTSGFDKTVKVWRVAESSMEFAGEWLHEGHVNFVAVSKSGMVATGADVPHDAIRIYHVQSDPENVATCSYHAFSCPDVRDGEGNLVDMDTWGLFPATMRWGLVPEAASLLLVGYSPRGDTGDDNDIPEAFRSSGQLCLWDGRTGDQLKITSATTSNVFEVLWHPTQESFIAATVPQGLEVAKNVKTQIRIFQAKVDQGEKIFWVTKVLDCFAPDMNELTIMPNGPASFYVTAGGTDSKAYVWDSGLSQSTPIHILPHGPSLEEFSGGHYKDDTGVKFTAWGSSLDRFYTGSSDGVVRVWNVRSTDGPSLVRVLLEAPGQIMSGAFSPDGTKLLIGDASGRISMLSLDEEQTESSWNKPIRQPIVPHPEPDPPEFDAEGRLIFMDNPRPAASTAQSLLTNCYLRRDPDPTVGVLQGPRYAEMDLFYRDAHKGDNPAEEYLASFSSKFDTRWNWHGFNRRRNTYREIKDLGDVQQHQRNLALDVDLHSIQQGSYDEDFQSSLESQLDYDFVYESDSAEQ